MTVGRLERRRRRGRCGAVRLRSSRKFWPRLLARGDAVAGDDLAQRRQRGRGRTPVRRQRARLAAISAASRSAAIRLSGARDALAGDVERGAVVGRGAHERQAQRDVDAAIEIDRLDRDQRLVVIHAQRRVVACRAAAWNIVSAASGPRASIPARAQFGDGRRDDLDLLAAEAARFAGMRVEPGNREDRRGDAEIAAQRRRGDPAGMNDFCRVDSASIARRSARWIVTGTTRSSGHTSIITGAAAAPGELGEIFGMAGMAKAGAVEAVLVDRVGDDRRRAAGDDIGDRGVGSRR